MEEKTLRITIIAVTILFLAVLGAILKTCSDQSDRRTECMRTGASAADCKMLFPTAGDR